MGSSVHLNQEIKVNNFETPKVLKLLNYAFLIIGAITFALGFFKNPERMWTSYLTAFFFFTTIACGAMFFIAFNHAARAGWSVSIRRLAEAVTSFFPVMLITSLILILGFKYLYAWSGDGAASLSGGKQLYLSSWFVILRMLAFGVGSCFFGWLIVGNSLKQDQTREHALTNKNVKNSIAYIAFFSIFFTLFSIDLLMSLLPTWYSTIYGVYTFSGALQSAMAVMALLIIWMRNSSWVSGYITVEHQHDIGKFLKGFTVFWAYIAFSQFMLIWYANVPEETEFYILRSLNGWMPVSMFLLIFKFIVPFLTLLPRSSKRNDSILASVSILVLITQYVDIYWLVYPNFFDGIPQFGFWEIGMFLGFLGLFSVTVTRFMTKNSLVAIQDPRIHEALKHHVTY